MAINPGAINPGAQSTNTGDSPLSRDESPSLQTAGLVGVVLQEAIRTTTSDADKQASWIQEELAEFLEIRSGSDDSSLWPALVELVSAVLRRHLTNIFDSEQQLERIATRVAETLYDDVEVRRNLQVFWGRLKASAQ